MSGMCASTGCDPHPRPANRALESWWQHQPVEKWSSTTGPGLSTAPITTQPSRKAGLRALQRHEQPICG